MKLLASLQTFQPVLVDSGKVKPTRTRRHSARGQCRQGGYPVVILAYFVAGCEAIDRDVTLNDGFVSRRSARLRRSSCRVGTFAAPQRVFECVSARPLIPACEPQKACDSRTDRRHRGQLWQERRRPRVRRACRRSLRRCREHAPGRLAAAEPSGRRRAATADWCCGTPVICLEARRSVGDCGSARQEFQVEVSVGMLLDRPHDTRQRRGGDGNRARASAVGCYSARRVAIPARPAPN